MNEREKFKPPIERWIDQEKRIEGVPELSILTSEPDEIRSLLLRDILPEGVEIKYRKLPENEQRDWFYPRSREYILYEPAEIDEPFLVEIL